jgi:hypothetical protein
VQAHHTERSPSEYFLRYVGRSVYGEIRKYSYSDLQTESTTDTGDVLAFHAERLLKDFSIPLAILGFLGLVVGANRIIVNRRKRGSDGSDEACGFALVIISYLVYFVVVMFYPSGDILKAPQYNLEAAGPGLMLPLEVLWSIFIGMGFLVIQKAISGSTGKRVGLFVFLIAVVALAGMNIVGNKPYSDKSKDTLMHEYCLNVMNSCPAGAHLIVAGDEIYAFDYINHVLPEPTVGLPLGIRPDLEIEAWGSSLQSYSELADISKAMTEAVVRASSDPPHNEIDTTYFNSGFLNNESLQGYTLSRRGIVFAFVPPRDDAGLVDTPDQLRDQTGIKSYLPGMPDNYVWTYWGGNLIESGTSAKSSKWEELWAPDEDIRWRIGEMLLFYGTASLLSGDREKARAYFNQCVLVEPENNDVRRYLIELESND